MRQAGGGERGAAFLLHLLAALSGDRYHQPIMSDMPTVGGKHERSGVPWLEPPRWVQRLTACADGAVTGDHQRAITTRVCVNDDVACISVRAAGAARLAPLDFQRRTIEAYEAVIARLAHVPARQPVRFWNYIPRIGDRIDETMDRYMLFNAGRFAAYTGWYGAEAHFPCRITTASGVGHDGDDLYVHCLATVKPGVPIENPRQVPAYRYSPHYGPYPPSFARAVRVPADALRLALHDADHTGDSATPLILVGGTASIRGERSRHISNLRRQVRETLTNLASLVQAAVEQDGDRRTDTDRAADDPWLMRFCNLCVYYVHEDHLSALKSLVQQRFASACEIEYRRATLCRPELLVEIEGVAEAASSAHRSATSRQGEAASNGTAGGHGSGANRTHTGRGRTVYTP